MQNDALAVDTFVITGTPGNADWTVQYFLMGATTPLSVLTAAGYSVTLSPGGSVGLYARVTPSNVPPAGSGYPVAVRGCVYCTTE